MLIYLKHAISCCSSGHHLKWVSPALPFRVCALGLMLGRSSRNVYRNVLSSCSPFVLRNAPSSRVHGKRPHLIIRLLASTPGPYTNRESSTINLKSVEEEA